MIKKKSKKIVAHGYNFEKVYEKAKKYGDDPLFDKVLDAEHPAYGPIQISIFLKSLLTKPIA